MLEQRIGERNLTCTLSFFENKPFGCVLRESAPFQCLSNFDWTLSHLSAHVVNRLLRENRKFIPKLFIGKKKKKNV